MIPNLGNDRQRKWQTMSVQTAACFRHIGQPVSAISVRKGRQIVIIKERQIVTVGYLRGKASSRRV